MKSEYSNHQLATFLKTLLESDIPFQFVPYTGIQIIKKFCQDFHLPEPMVKGGNIVIGNLATCDFLITAHLDESSFGFISIDNNGAWLAPYHKYVYSEGITELTILGVRDNKFMTIGKGKLIEHNKKPFCETAETIKMSDRAVYYFPTTIEGDIITGKAIDDRVGVLITLLSLKELFDKYQVATVLSDGEEHIPEGYFSRNFPQILHLLKESCKICFVDGIYRNGLEPVGFHSPPKEALIIPHSSYGKGYVVSPMIFAKLRDELIPNAKKQGIKVELCSAYYSRGDDWGLITNPILGKNFDSFFVSYGAWSNVHTIPSSINIDCIKNCVNFLRFIVEHKVLS